MNNSKPKTGEGHVLALDGVRGLAIAAVLVFHFWQALNAYQFSPMGTKVLRLALIGQKGVDLFFVLSGFLITGILLRTKGSEGFFKTFYIRRSLRIFPLYFLVVFACLMVGSWFSLPNYQWHGLWWYLVYLQNIGQTFWPGQVTGPGHFWSLAVEEHYYLAWPFLVYYLNRRTLIKVSLALIAFAPVLRYFMLEKGFDVFTFTLCRIDTLALGSLLALFFVHEGQWQKVVKLSRRLILPISGLAFASFFVFSGKGNHVVEVCKYTLFAMLCSFIIILALSPGPGNPAPRIFQNNWLRSLGKTSYAIYVFHPFIFEQVANRFYQSKWSPTAGMFWTSLVIEFGVCMGLTILASQISWVAFEKPLLKLKDKFPNHPRPA